MRTVGVAPDCQSPCSCIRPWIFLGGATGCSSKGFFVGTSVIRTPHVSSEPAWAARKKTPAPVHPGDAAQPVSEGLEKTQGQVVRQTLHRVNRCLQGTLDGLQDSPVGRGESHGYHPWGSFV